jgi:hypothetical protein
MAAENSRRDEISSSTFTGAIVDLDGTVYLGERRIGGARNGIETLRAAGLSVVFLTNNPIERREAYQRRLQSLDIDAELAKVAHLEFANLVDPLALIFVSVKIPIWRQFLVMVATNQQYTSVGTVQLA